MKKILIAGMTLGMMVLIIQGCSKKRRYLKLAREAISTQSYKTAEHNAKMVLQINPECIEAKSILFHSLYKNEKIEWGFVRKFLLPLIQSKNEWLEMDEDEVKESLGYFSNGDRYYTGAGIKVKSLDEILQCMESLSMEWFKTGNDENILDYSGTTKKEVQTQGAMILLLMKDKEAAWWVVKNMNDEIGKFSGREASQILSYIGKNMGIYYLKSIEKDKRLSSKMQKYIAEAIPKAGENDCGNFIQAINKDSIEEVKFLIEKGADVNAKTKDGKIVLFLAAEKNSIEVAKLLIEKGANVNAKNGAGWTVLMLAADGNNIEMAKSLIEKGADVNAKTEDGVTALMWAVWTNSPDMAKLLLEKGANVNAKTEDGTTPLMMAKSTHPTNCQKMVDLLKKHGAN